MKLANFQIKTRCQPESVGVDLQTARYRKDRTVSELVAEQADATPNAVAVIHNDTETTYRALNERSTTVAQWLVDQ